MKYIKTFESFAFEDSNLDRLDEGFFGDLKDKVVDWFRGIKDAVMQKVAVSTVAMINQKKDDPVVKQKITEIQKAYADLSDADKKKFQSLFGSKDAIEKTGEKLEAAGIEKMVESLQESQHSEEALNEALGNIVGAIVKYLGVSAFVANVIVMAIGLITSSGGYITLGIAAGMSAGLFVACVCVIIAITGGLAMLGKNMQSGF
jgi:hypothetical protein